MKAVLIVYNVAVDAELTEQIESLGVDCYTKLTNVLGKGRASEPHLGSDVWPATNNAALIITDQAKAQLIMEKVRQLRQKLASEGLKAFMWQIDDIT